MQILYKVAVIYYGICATTGFVIAPLSMCYVIYAQWFLTVQAMRYKLILFPIVGLVLFFLAAATLCVIKPLALALYKAWKDVNRSNTCQ